MVPIIVLIILFSTLAIISASVPQPFQGTTALDSRLFTMTDVTTLSNLSAQPSNISFSIGSDLILPSNISTMIPDYPDTEPSNVISVRCDPAKTVNFLSCRGALGYTVIDDEQTTFAQRNTGIPEDIPLPFRITGGEYLQNRI